MKQTGKEARAGYIRTRELAYKKCAGRHALLQSGKGAFATAQVRDLDEKREGIR